MAKVKLKTGDKAPDFSLIADGKKIALKDFRGQKVVLYFYPKDDTPGCTKEACAFRDDMASLTKKNAVVVGVSMDDDESHKKFSEKFGLNFMLLPDVKGDICNAYGVYGLKSLYGRKFFGVKRTTFLIGENGKIAHIFENVKPKGHAEEVMEKL